MKVRELIQQLQKFDKELEVVFQNKVCDFTEACVLDNFAVRAAIQNEECEWYYNFVPDEANDPRYT